MIVRPVLEIPNGYKLTHVLALQIGLGVSISWSRTIYKEFELLAGKAASDEFMQLVIYKAATYTDMIDKVDTVRAYHVRSLIDMYELSPRFLTLIVRVGRYDLCL